MNAPRFLRVSTRLAGVLVFVLAPVVASAQAPAAPAAAPAPAMQVDAGATAWILASSALVLFMTPGLALFYAGMARSKNVLGTMMHSVFCMGIVSIQWVIIGYSLAFSDESVGGIVGSLKLAFLNNVSPEHAVTVAGFQYPISQMLHMTYQMMFAIITPALIAGAFAERVKFSSYVLFTLLWTTLVYDPVAHWVWGGGILADVNAEKLPRTWLMIVAGVGAIDFAGGTVVHITSGVSALVFCLLIGKRRGYPAQPMLPNSLVITTLGAGILWFGWFGFNGGSGLAADGRAVSAFAATHVCAASAAVCWAAVEWLHRGKASILGVATGLVAGLVCVTPASGFVTPMSALILGCIVSPVCYFFVAIVKNKLGYDDSLDAFGVHGVGGSLGALLTGLFCSSDKLLGGYEPGFKQFHAQAIAVLVTIAYSVIMTTILVILVDKTLGIRLEEEDEMAGLDLSQHGEVGYNP